VRFGRFGETSLPAAGTYVNAAPTVGGPLAPSQEDVGMMIHRLGQLAHLVRETQGIAEVVEFILLL
jgi:hypothetical protein